MQGNQIQQTVDLVDLEAFLAGMQERTLSEPVCIFLEAMAEELRNETYQLHVPLVLLEEAGANDTDRVVAGLLIQQVRDFMKSIAR